MAAVLRPLVCDLCGDSGGAQQLCSLCGVSPYSAASGNRQLRLYREIVALMPLLFVSILVFFYSSKPPCCVMLQSIAACRTLKPSAHCIRCSASPRDCTVTCAATSADSGSTSFSRHFYQPHVCKYTCMYVINMINPIRKAHLRQQTLNLRCIKKKRVSFMPQTAGCCTHWQQGGCERWWQAPKTRFFIAADSPASSARLPQDGTPSDQAGGCWTQDGRSCMKYQQL